jgi:hypothetical protein
MTTTVPRIPSSVAEPKGSASFWLAQASFLPTTVQSRAGAEQNDPVIRLVGNRDPNTPRFSQCHDPRTKTALTAEPAGAKGGFRDCLNNLVRIGRMAIPRAL